MRQRNLSAGTRKIHFYGVDLTGGDGERGEFLRARRSIEAALTYVERCDKDFGQHLRGLFEPLLDRFNDRSYARLSAGKRGSLSGAIAELISLFERRRLEFLDVTSEADYARAHRNAVVAQQLDAFFRLKPAVPIDTPAATQLDWRECLNARDAALASNVRWVRPHQGPCPNG